MGLSEDMQLLREEYRQCRAYFEQDGIIDDSEHQQLDAMEAEINRLESDFMDQQQSTTQNEGDDDPNSLADSSKKLAEELKNKLQEFISKHTEVFK